MNSSSDEYNPHSVLLLEIALVILLLLIGSCKRSDPGLESTNVTYYPLYFVKQFTIPDTLQYFYNTIDARGTALSGGEFFVYLKYPVFRSESKNIGKLVDWLDDQIFVLVDNGQEDTEVIRKRFKADYPAYANYTLNSWLSNEESTYMGCIQESLAVEVVLNTDVITMKTHHKGYWGGANGDDNVHYMMFDKNYNQIDIRSLIEDGKQDEFNQMLITEYNKNIVAWREYDDNYKLNPDDLALIPEGLIAVYFGYVHAEGQPTMLIKPDKFVRFLKPQYRGIFDASKDHHQYD